MLSILSNLVYIVTYMYGIYVYIYVYTVYTSYAGCKCSSMRAIVLLGLAVVYITISSTTTYINAFIFIDHSSWLYRLVVLIDLNWYESFPNQDRVWIFGQDPEYGVIMQITWGAHKEGLVHRSWIHESY